MGSSVGAIMLAVGCVIILPGALLIKRFDKQAGYGGIGNPYPYSGLLSTLGILLVLLGGFCMVFGIAMIII